MKMKFAFISAAVVFGLVLGLASTLVLLAIALPSSTGYLLTLAEKADYDLMAKNLEWVSRAGSMNVVFVIAGLIFFITLILFMAILNPRLGNAMKSKKGFLKLLVVLFGSMVWFYLLKIPVTMPGDTGGQGPWNMVVLIAGTAMLWLAAGEAGWAGDFSSWKMGVQGQRARPMESLVLGGLVGGASFGLLSFLNWALNKYFILVSEVLDKSGDVSYRGYTLLACGIIFLCAMAAPIIAGFIVALSPTYGTPRQRRLQLIFPGALLLVVAAIIGGTYWKAAAYDLDKSGLAEVLGIPEKATASRTVALFTAGKGSGIILQEWPLEAAGYGLGVSSTIAVSEENLRKVEDYLDEHQEGSVFTYAAHDVLVRGYHVLWDMRKGLEQQAISAQSILLPRQTLVARLRYLPVTPENLRSLQTYTDETRWYAGGRSALKIAEGLAHFGKSAEARTWLNKAKERGADVSQALFLKEAVLKDGKIQGRILVNGKPPISARVALVRYTGAAGKLDVSSLLSKLVDAGELDRAGRFAFGRLGAGEYLLALMADKETIPYTASSEKIEVRNSPDVVRLGGRITSADLGEINIVLR